MNNKAAQLEYITLAFKAVREALECIDKKSIREHARELFKGNKRGVIFFEGWQDFDFNEDAKDYFTSPEGPVGLTSVNGFTNLLYLKVINDKPTVSIINLGEYLNDFSSHHHVNQLAHLANIENLIHALTQTGIKHVPGMNWDEAEEVYKEATRFDFDHVTPRRRGLSAEEIEEREEYEATEHERWG